MEKYWDEYTKSELLKLPERDWELKSEYDSVLLVNTRMKHDSGYNLFAVVGCNKGIPVEIAGYMDDFRLDVENWRTDEYVIIEPYSVAIDCSMHGVFQIHTSRYKIGVGSCCSTTHFYFRKIK